MKNTTLSKKFYNNGLNYYEAIKILKTQILYSRDSFVIYPLLYLERHIVELFLKSLIIYSSSKCDVNNKILIEWNNQTFDISKTHSLKILLEKFIEIQTSTRLIPIYDDKIEEINRIIISFDQIDKTGEYYRYPISKSGQISKFKLFKTLDDVPKFKSNMNNYWIFDFREGANKEIRIVKLLDKKTLYFANEVYEIIDYLKSLLDNIFINKLV